MKTTLSSIILFLVGQLLPLTAETINGAGATFPFPVYSAWAKDYEKATSIKLNYQSIGSGGGIKQIENKTVDFGASDKPLTPDELSQKKLLQFPAIIGGIVPVFNLGDLKKLQLDGTTLCKIYLGEIENWDDQQIKAINPGVNLPKLKVSVVARSDGSGSTALFTRFLSEVCPAWKEKVGSDTSVKFPVGINGKGNEGVTNYIRARQGTIGYVEFAYAHQNNLTVAKLKNPAGVFVEAGIKTFQEAASSAKFESSNHFNQWLINSPGKNAWPISGASFILLSKEKPDVSKNVIKFFDWTLAKGDETAKTLTYVPLPPNVKKSVQAYWKSNNLK